MKLRIVPVSGVMDEKYWVLEGKWLFWWIRISDRTTNKDTLIDLAEHLRTPPEYL